MLEVQRAQLDLAQEARQPRLVGAGRGPALFLSLRHRWHFHPLSHLGFLQVEVAITPAS